MASAVQNTLTTDGVTGEYAFRTLSVAYPADSVSDLAPTSHEIQEFEAGDLVGGVTDYKTNNLAKYLSSIGQGITSAVGEARYVHQQCPHALLILAGYSQGAMVMHQAELQLEAAGDSGLLGQIAGTLLLGDGDRVPHTSAREFGTSSSKSEGVRTWVSSVLSHGVDHGQDVPDPATTANICNAGDIVCATSLTVLENASAGIAVHTSYVHGSYVNPALTSAADWVAQLAAGRILGSRWSAHTAPLPADAAADPGVNISLMACYSASWCAAVGSYINSSGGSSGLLLTRSGTVWSAAEAPLPPGHGTANNADLYSVSCPSASSCIAVGGYWYGIDGGGLIETWSGNGWSAVTAPNPPLDPGNQAQGGSVTSVACPSASVCVADGTYGEYDPSTGETTDLAMVLTDSGGTWTAVQPPLPPTGESGSANFDANISGTVACPSTTWCTAVGTYGDNTDIQQGLLLTWSGGAWTAAQAPAPPASVSVEPYTVACPAVSSCTVIGIYDDSAGNPHGLINTGAGSAWTLTKMRSSDLFSVACPSVGSCIITGLGGIWTGSGTTWRPTAAPPLLSDDYLGPVACPPTGPCAIAAEPSDNSALQMMAGAGTNWTGFDVPANASLSGAVFNAVVCPAASTCIAAGFVSGGQAVVAVGPS